MSTPREQYDAMLDDLGSTSRGRSCGGGVDLTVARWCRHGALGCLQCNDPEEFTRRVTEGIDMTKKDYQALAGALYHSRIAPSQDPQWIDTRDAIADVLAADNPRFDRATFVAACEDGNVGRQPRTVHKAKPLCAQAMGCLCAKHARGAKASTTCDARE